MSLDLSDFRQRLEAGLVQVDQASTQAAAAAIVALDQSAVGRLSRMDAMQQQAVAEELRGRLATRKRKFEAAMARMVHGTYGRCCQCDADIERERLLADPAAVFCSECMAERDGDKRDGR